MAADGTNVMGGGNQQQPNPLIPDTGAAAYWYVDPRAGQPSQPAQSYSPKGEAPTSRADDALREALSRLVQTSRSASGKLYDPMEQVHLGRQQEAERMSAQHQMGPEDVYKTVNMEIGGKEWEVPAVFDNMTDYERNIIHYLPHTQWPSSIRDKIESNARDNLEQGMDPFGNPIQPKIGF